AVDGIVDEPGLADGAEGGVAPGGAGEDDPEPVVGVGLGSGGVGLVAGVAVGFAHEEGGETEAEPGKGDPEGERVGAEPVTGGQGAGGEVGQGLGGTEGDDEGRRGGEGR